MSGWFGKMFWRKVYPKLPSGVSDAIQKAGNTFDEIEGKTIIPTKQHPAMPQAEVNAEFTKKVERIHPHSHGKL